MQNSVAPVAAVSRAASTSEGMSSQAARTGRVEQAGLRAEVAVLGAAAGLDRDDALDLDLRTAPPHPHLVGERECIGHAVIGQLEHGQDVLLAEPDAMRQDLPARLVEDVVRHGCTSSRSLEKPKARRAPSEPPPLPSTSSSRAAGRAEDGEGTRPAPTRRADRQPQLADRPVLGSLARFAGRACSAPGPARISLRRPDPGSRDPCPASLRPPPAPSRPW